MENATLHASREPLYLQVAEVLRQRIVKGTWKVGDRLPSLLELAEEFSVARVTARQAVKLLEQEGYVAPKRGRGTTVLPRPEGFQKINVKTRLSDLVERYRQDVPGGRPSGRPFCRPARRMCRGSALTAITCCAGPMRATASVTA